ncbi:flagellar hook-associated protein FlgK [Pseudomonas sp. BN417]|uniref:flagellar hook-associated protein FlgK n=1 Tax=Pseudomonas sp. BN417 TaxID=2567890 RepID=UPI002455B7FE|nr:flagellar hook-associated protein FlgK [Pseudomonas sp. BN417]MDH4554418.1 flagellar hook-associated protein FlgK [Pseudomonas sp. BN417]
MADLLNIGLSGLAVSKTQLSITGHNITNVNTPGFSRQDASQAARLSQFSGAGYIGSGAALTEVRRTYSEFLTSQLRNSTALNSDVAAYKSQIDQLDSLLAGTTTGISPSLQKFFASLQAAAEDPANTPARELVLADAEGLARRFNNLHDRLSEQNGFINSQMQSISEQVNRLASSIGSLNNAIAEASANGHAPNDLLDARDEAVRQLSSFIGVSVVKQDDNSLNLFIGTGQPLVVGGTVSRLDIVNGTGDPTRFEVELVNGGTRQNVTSQVSGGQLGGLIRYRNEVLDSSLNALGRLAMAVTEQVNGQLGQGLDLKGRVGSMLFGDYNTPELADLRGRAFADNASGVDASVTIDDTSRLGTSDYRLEFDGTSYQARRLSDGAPMTVTVDPANPLKLTLKDASGRDQGFSVTLTGTPAAGDRFMLEPTRTGASSISVELDQADQLAFAAPLRSEANLQNRGNAVIGAPEITQVIDPANLASMQALRSDPLQQGVISGFPSLTLTYDSASGQLQFPSPLPPGVRITTVPQLPPAPAPTDITGLAVTPGQSNSLSFAVEVTVGGVTQSYSIQQSFSGQPQNGDTFTLGFNKGGVSDNRNAQKLVDLQNKSTVGVDSTLGSKNSGVSFSDGYGQLVERVGTLTAQARQDSEASGAILKQASDNRDSLSGVNLDEEAANLIKFEQYYNASAQIIQVARSLFDTLISSFR